ncbi:MAG: hypothetical protein U0638_06965 [Phycisphaerales bacterium]
MIVLGVEHLDRLVRHEVLSAKMVFNAAGVVFLPVKQQHRDHKAEGISYEDDYKGNAMAAMLAPESIEIRRHSAFSDVQVVMIIASLWHDDRLAPLRGWKVTYQGRPLAIPGA